MILFRIGSKLVRSLHANDQKSERIVENPGLVQQLMCGPACGHSMRGSAEFAFLHAQI